MCAARVPSQPPLPSASVSPCVAAAAPVPARNPANAPCPVARFQNMPEQKRCEQRRIDEAEHQLQEIHDVVEVRRQVGRCDRKRRHPPPWLTRATVKVMRIGRMLADVALIKIVGPDGVERGDVARHAGHERCHQRRQSDAQHSGWIELSHERGQRLIVVGLRRPV